MKKRNIIRLTAVLLAVITLASVLVLPASAAYYSIPTINFKFKSGAYTNAYSENGIYKGRVYTGDVVRVIGYANNGSLILLECPWGKDGHPERVYCRTNELKFKATKKIAAYDTTGKYIGKVYVGDTCTILSVDTTYVKCLCPWDGWSSPRLIMVKAHEIYG